MSNSKKKIFKQKGGDKSSKSKGVATATVVASAAAAAAAAAEQEKTNQPSLRGDPYLAGLDAAGVTGKTASFSFCFYDGPVNLFSNDIAINKSKDLSKNYEFVTGSLGYIYEVISLIS